MTKEQAREAAEVMLAYARGETIQWRWKGDYGVWNNDSVITFNFDDTDYRVKPLAPTKPTYRPWTPEEVPVGAQIRGKLWDKSERSLITHIYRDTLNGSDKDFRWTLTQALSDCEYSIDNGKTWLPCGILVTA